MIYQSKIRLNEVFLRDLINMEVIPKLNLKNISFLEKTQQRFWFNDIRWWKFLTGTLGIISDSNLAIQTFLNSKIEEKVPSGESYLRLYWVLSSVYILKQSILELVHLFNVQNKSKIENNFNQLEILFLRHTISAHPTNFEEKVEEKKNWEYINFSIKRSFKIDRHTLLRDWNITLRFENNEWTTYNIYNLLNDFLELVELNFTSINEKAIKTIFKTSKDKQDKYLTKLNSLI